METYNFGDELLTRHWVPEYINEVEFVLGRPLFDNPALEAMFVDHPEQLDVASRESRIGIYIGGLRIIAAARAEDRKKHFKRPESLPTPIHKEIVPDHPIERKPLSTGELLMRRLFNYRWFEENNSQKLKSIAAKAQDDVSSLLSKLREIHWGELTAKKEFEIASEPTPEQETLRTVQRKYVHDALRTMRLPPKTVRIKNASTGDMAKEYAVQGTIIDAPMGIGKTVCMARTAVGIGIGKPDSKAKDPTRKRALIVVFWQNQNDQLTGKIGDDTFRRFAGEDMRVTALYQFESDVTGDAVIVSADMFMRHFRDGKLMDQEFDVLMADEAQHLLGPRMQQVLLEHWQGPILAYTGTPTYSHNKDLRKLLPYHIKHADLLSAIDDGMINGAQLFSVRVGGKEYLEEITGTGYETLSAAELRDQAVEDFAIPLLVEGRRGIIFCETGNQTEHAKDMAARFNGMLLPNGRFVVAKALSTFNPSSGPGSNQAIIQEYNEGKIDLLTTTHLGTESLNADIDMVLLACDIHSIVKLLQAIGRGTRLSDTFDLTIYAEFILGKGGRSLYEAFVQTHVTQGKTFTRAKKDPAPSDELDAKDAPAGSLTWQGFNPTVLPNYLQKMLQTFHHKTVGYLVLRPGLDQEPVPEGYLSLDAILQQSDVSHLPHKYAKRRLEAAEYSYVDHYADGKINRYYEPSAATFFAEHTFPPMADDGDIGIFALSRLLGVDYSTLKKYAENNSIVGQDKFDANTEVRTFSAEEAAKLRAIIDKELPWGTPKDRTTRQLDEKYNMPATFFQRLARNFKMQSRHRRYHERTEDTPNGASLSGEDVAKLEAYFKAYPCAKPTDRVQDDIAKFAGLHPKTAQHMFTDEIKARSKRKWYTQVLPDNTKRTSLRQVWPDDIAKSIGRYFRAQKATRTLPEHLIIPRALVSLFDMHPDTLVSRARSIAGTAAEKRTLGFGDTTQATCVSWDVMIQCICDYAHKIKKDAPRIAPKCLPTGPHDRDERRLAYARYLQANFVNAKYLGFDPAKEIEKFEQEYPQLKIR